MLRCDGPGNGGTCPLRGASEDTGVKSANSELDGDVARRAERHGDVC